jgi:hypothetical protein
MPQTQTYKNHARFFPPFHFFVLPVLLVNFLNSIRHVWNRPMRDTWFELVVAVALMLLAFSSRAQALAVQDRVIRLEMQLRLRGILPMDLQGRISELGRHHFVALRFASDGEIPDLVRDILAGKLTTQKSIKERIKDWQGDFLRA